MTAAHISGGQFVYQNIKYTVQQCKQEIRIWIISNTIWQQLQTIQNSFCNFKVRLKDSHLPCEPGLDNQQVNVWITKK